MILLIYITGFLFSNYLILPYCVKIEKKMNPEITQVTPDGERFIMTFFFWWIMIIIIPCLVLKDYLKHQN